MAATRRSAALSSSRIPSREHQPVDGRVLRGESHVIGPSLAKVGDRIDGDLQLDFACRVPLQADLGESVEEPLLVTEDPVEDGLADTHPVTHRAGRHVGVLGCHQQLLGRVEQRCTDLCRGVCHDLSIPIDINGTNRATLPVSPLRK
jgi:hypothetical protein